MLVILGLLLLFPMRMALAARKQVLHGHVPAAVDHLAPIGQLDQTKRLKLAIALPPRHPEELTRLLHDLYDPKSPRYRHFLESQRTSHAGAVLVPARRTMRHWPPLPKRTAST